jgi:RNA polymerase sigma factor (sigma-70 family)
MATRTELDRQRENAELLEDLLADGDSHFRRQARGHSNGGVDPEDVLQHSYELFIERFRPPYQPLAWLMTTIKREAWSQRRRAYRNREIPIRTRESGDDEEGHDLAAFHPDPGPDPSDRVLDLEDLEQVSSHFRALKADERTALGLLAFGYTYAEIAAINGWTHTKVNRCVAEGREAVRKGIATGRR